MKDLGMNFARIGDAHLADIENAGAFWFEYFGTGFNYVCQRSQDWCLSCIPTDTTMVLMVHPEARIKNLDGTLMEHGSRL